MSKKLSVVVPVYYNAQSLPELLTRLDALKNDLLKIDLNFEVIAVDDGSKDNSIGIKIRTKKSNWRRLLCACG
jgi:dolichol-phosphate mannosyltransferase